MTWAYSIAVAAICAPIGGALGLLVGVKGVRWFHISSREGESGYYVLFLMLFGGVIGGLLGLSAGLAAWAMDRDVFWQQLLAGLAATLFVGAFTLACFRLKADIPPTHRGKPLTVEVELRWPAGKSEPPHVDAEKSRIMLMRGSRWRRIVVNSQDGAFDPSGPRTQDNRWVLGARLPLYTRKGKRLMSVGVDGLNEGFLLMIPRNPRGSRAEWSVWLPYPRPDGKPAVNTLTYRYRVVPAAE